MAPFALAAIAALSLTGSLAQPPAPPPERAPAPIPSAAEIAATAQNALPWPLERGAAIVAVRAEGSLLIMTMEVPAAVGAMAGDQFALGIARGFCRGPLAQEIFASGLRLRVDRASGGGAPLRLGTVIESCPES